MVQKCRVVKWCLKTGQTMSVLWSKKFGIRIVHLITWSDHLKTGQKSVRKVLCLDFKHLVFKWLLYTLLKAWPVLTVWNTDGILNFWPCHRPWKPLWFPPRCHCSSCEPSSSGTRGSRSRHHLRTIFFNIDTTNVGHLFWPPSMVFFSVSTVGIWILIVKILNLYIIFLLLLIRHPGPSQ